MISLISLKCKKIKHQQNSYTNINFQIILTLVLIFNNVDHSNNTVRENNV